MKNFFGALPRADRDGMEVILCPEDGHLPREFKPVHVEPWRPERRAARRPAKRATSIERVAQINDERSLNTTFQKRRFSIPGEANTDEEQDGLNQRESWEFDDPDYFEGMEAHGLRSLAQPSITSVDYAWRAPAARCRSCGAITWIASIADGIRMLHNSRHRKGCSCPPNRLEVELSCGE